MFGAVSDVNWLVLNGVLLRFVLSLYLPTEDFKSVRYMADFINGPICFSKVV